VKNGSVLATENYQGRDVAAICNIAFGGASGLVGFGSRYQTFVLNWKNEFLALENQMTSVP
jgi:hypothetical protein